MRSALYAAVQVLLAFIEAVGRGESAKVVELLLLRHEQMAPTSAVPNQLCAVLDGDPCEPKRPPRLPAPTTF